MPIKLEITKTKVPVKVWSDEIESSALDQATNLADTMPIHSHMALMPDSHMGYLMPIGGVLPLVNAISVECVGVDIGCGMYAIRTDRTDIDINDLKAIYKLIRERIPVGFDHRKHAKGWEGFDRMPNLPILEQEKPSAFKQLGTLGGGNHFLEFQKGSDGFIWVMLHSGSRNFGFKTANYYADLCKKVRTDFFPMDSSLGHEYFDAMSFCLDFALENREIMMRDVEKSITEVINAKVMEQINIHHNYAAPEVHFGKSVIVHRKGATLATKDTIGIIPGSMGSNSYIVKGLGNPESFQSCSHGAGRRMSRSQAKREITKEMYLESLTSIGLEASEGEVRIDESVFAYKDISKVLENQSDLVEVLVKLTPYKLPAIKG
jgi:tRNA-splicing ligase RtcB